MSPEVFQIRLCGACGLRFPLVNGTTLSYRCPRCLGETTEVLSQPLPLEKQIEPDHNPLSRLGSIQISALLDNVRSAWNVGAIFRTADALGVRRLYLCGITPTPEDRMLAKTALSAETWVPWEYAPDSVLLATRLQAEGCRLCALELGEGAVELSKILDTDLMERKYDARLFHPVILILGNEVAGVDPGLLEISEYVLAIGMRGKKQSLNVAVAFGIAAYQLSLLADQSSSH